MQIEPVTNAEKNTKPARRMTCCKKWHEKLKKQQKKSIENTASDGIAASECNHINAYILTGIKFINRALFSFTRFD